MCNNPSLAPSHSSFYHRLPETRICCVSPIAVPTTGCYECNGVRTEAALLFQVASRLSRPSGKGTRGNSKKALGFLCLPLEPGVGQHLVQAAPAAQCVVLHGLQQSSLTPLCLVTGLKMRYMMM